MRDRPALTLRIDLPGLQVRVRADDVRVEADPIERLRSMLASLPDPKWRHVDGAGHEHRWTITEAAPLAGHGPTGDVATCDREWVHRECDGSCGGTCGGEGWASIVWRCRRCGEVLDPGPRYLPDYRGRMSGYPIRTGPATVTLRTANFGGRPPLGQPVPATLGFDGDDRVLPVQIAVQMIRREHGGGGVAEWVEWAGAVIEPPESGPTEVRTSGATEVRT